MIRVKHARLFSLAICAAITACSGGGGGVGDARTGGDFVVLKTEPATNGTLFLNEAIRVDFSNPVNLDSVDLSTVSFQVSDQLGNAVNEPVAGSFALDTSPGDATVGRRLLFVPRLPTNDTFTNGGFRPGRTYTVQLVGGSTVNNTVLRDQFGKGLAVPVSFRFSTSDGTTPAQLFRNPAAGGPRRAGFAISPTPDSTGVVLNKLGTDGVEIRLRFDQPLNPSAHGVRRLAESGDRPVDRSGRADSNRRPPAPKAGALPDCATSRACRGTVADAPRGGDQSCLRRYSWPSASSSSSMTSTSGRPAAMPSDTDTSRSAGDSDRDARRDSRISEEARSASATDPGTQHPNSSPPRRPAVP